MCVYDPDHRRAKLLRLTPKGRASKANAAIQRVLGVLEARATGGG